MNWTTTLAATAAFAFAASLPAFAQDGHNHEASGISREEILKSATNMVGEPIAYPTGAAEVTTEMVTFEPGGQTGYHTHPVPSWVYVLEGELEVRVDGQEPMRFMPGQAFMEPQDTNMQAFNVADQPTKLLVVSIGAQGQPTGQPAMTDPAQDDQAAAEVEPGPDEAQLIASAESAAPDHIPKEATIYDMEMQTVREGTNSWWCMPDNPGTPGDDPMCGDANTMEWMMALIEGTEPPEGKLGFSYMIAGGSTASNTDYTLTEPAEGSEWLEDGPHMMIVGVPEEVRSTPSDPVPDISTTYVMWGGSPYAHLMIPYTGATQ